MRHLLNHTLLAAALLALACATRPDDTNNGDNNNNNNTGTPDAGTGGTTGTPDAGDQNTGGDFVVTTIANAYQNAATIHAVDISDAVVVAEHHYGDPGAVTGTFYIQDNSGPGLAVFKKNTDAGDFPKIGDKVHVKGHFGKFDGLYEVSSSARFSQALTIEITGTGTVNGGALSPAGEPTIITDPAEYAGTAADIHDDKVGHVLQFNGQFEVTNARALVSTASDGGTKPEGFEITGGILVDDTHVYFDCIKGLDGGVGALDLSHGIRGVWDRYQDFGGGTAQNPAPTKPVLYPTSCDDLHPQPNE